MIGNTDYAGLATLIGALTGLIAGIVAAVAALRVNKKVTTGNGITLGQAATNIAAAVTTPPDTPPLGQIAADAADAIQEVHAAVNGGPSPHP